MAWVVTWIAITLALLGLSAAINWFLRRWLCGLGPADRPEIVIPNAPPPPRRGDYPQPRLPCPPPPPKDK